MRSTFLGLLSWFLASHLLAFDLLYKIPLTFRKPLVPSLYTTSNYSFGNADKLQFDLICLCFFLFIDLILVHLVINSLYEVF